MPRCHIFSSIRGLHPWNQLPQLGRGNIWGMMHTARLLSGGCGLIKSERLSVKPIPNWALFILACMYRMALFVAIPNVSSETGRRSHSGEITYCGFCFFYFNAIGALERVGHAQSASRAQIFFFSLHFPLLFLPAFNLELPIWTAWKGWHERFHRGKKIRWGEGGWVDTRQKDTHKGIDTDVNTQWHTTGLLFIRKLNICTNKGNNCWSVSTPNSLKYCSCVKVQQRALLKTPQSSSGGLPVACEKASITRTGGCTTMSRPTVVWHHIGKNIDYAEG